VKCRHCRNELTLTLIDLGSAPPSNAYLSNETLHAPEKWFPLRVLVCEKCWLVQTEDFAQADELFAPDYAYFSGFSSTWLSHSECYVTEMVQRFKLHAGSHVVEVGANDGYLLQYVQARNIPCTGIEPTASTAAAARAKGIAVVESFFGVHLAEELIVHGKSADLLVVNNVLAHVPDINDFVAGCAILLKPQGVATFEFPHLMKLVTENQFDTIYHEHFSYLSLTTVSRIFAANGLDIFDVEELPTHGGSLRVYARRADTPERCRDNTASARTKTLLNKETAAGLNTAAFYRGFQMRAEEVKNKFLSFLLEAQAGGLKVAAYGAAAKANTLLNFAGVRPDLLPYVVDRNAAKQGKYMPGSRIPIADETLLRETRPDYVIIFPWNIRDEISGQLDYIRQWSAQFAVAVPCLEVW
jgi:2-polyprenyl-3-methyl-5-hydroxy-6-metoxy-1,4-benzoquinol methylase